MKKLFVSLVALVAATMSYAQSSVLATLSHEGNISTFYGVSALKDAYNHAKSGDVITLSSGQFSAVDITRPVTIRGAGMGFNTIFNSDPTIIMGDFKINIPTTATSRFTLEGIYYNNEISIQGELKNATFLKDRFSKITCSYNNKVTNLTMIHCKVVNGITISSKSYVSCTNCIINEPHCNNEDSKFELSNCVLMKKSWRDDINNSYFKNCIIYMSTETVGSFSNIINASNTIYYCVAYGDTTDRWILFRNITNTTNKVVDNIHELFKTFNGVVNEEDSNINGTFRDNETFELTDEAKTAYLGTDGTQVGIYGGNMPFDPTVSGPQITHCNVASKSTADGKLSVDIEVKVNE